MSKGRKPLPTAIKKLHGTDQPCRINENEMQPQLVQDMPLAPEFLSELGQQEWYSVCTELLSLNMLASVDLSLLAAYCNEMATYIEIETALRQTGRVHVLYNNDGTVKYIQQLPEVNIARNALKSALQIAVQFGFTPSARTKISHLQLKKPQEQDPWDDL